MASKKSSVILPPGRIRLFKINSSAAKLLFPDVVKKAMVDMKGVSIGDIDWYIDSQGRLWTNDAFEDHGQNYYCLSNHKKFERSASEVEVL